MGNWMTVKIVGTCDKGDVPALRQAIDPGADYENFHCLSYVKYSIASLPMWADEKINVMGNLAESDYNSEGVAEALDEIATCVSSLNVKVHCGGAYESKDCVATVTLASGKVTIGEPEVKTLVKDNVSFADAMRDLI
jgi:hypothetical protein